VWCLSVGSSLLRMFKYVVGVKLCFRFLLLGMYI